VESTLSIVRRTEKRDLRVVPTESRSRATAR
jgi:hypothetical protein